MDFSKSIFCIFILLKVSLAIEIKVIRAPKMVFFDLEFTLFPHLVDSFLNPPFHLGERPGEVVDANGTVIKSYPEVPEIFKYLNDHGINFGVCTSSMAVEESKEIIKLFGWTRYFKIVEVYPMIDEDHMRWLSRRENISLTEMLVFDDEPYVHRMMEDLNVISKNVKNGMTMQILKEGLEKYSRKRSSKAKIMTSAVKFVICDFEISPMPNGDCLLLTGALVNSIARYPPMRLQGRPYYIPKKGNIGKYNHRQHGYALQFVSKLFNTKKKEETLAFIMRHFYEALCHTSGGNKSTLTISEMNRYLSGYGQKPVVVFWNGSTDKYILERLQIRGIVKFLSLSAKQSSKVNGTYELLMKDMDRDNLIICSINIGKVNKTQGFMLNLHECHNAVCNETHNDVTYWHDPYTDVIYTRCLFWRILKKFQPISLYNYCTWRPGKFRPRIHPKINKGKKVDKNKKIS